MRDKVYIVDSGSYSDYRIEAVFATEEEAKKYIYEVLGDKDHKYDYWECELSTILEKYEYEIDICWDDFTIKDIRVSGFRVGRKKDYIRYWGEDSKSLQIVVQADTAERAIKIASERLTQIKALEEVKFPRLRERFKSKRGYMEYPTYDFVTGKIIEKPTTI